MNKRALKYTVAFAVIGLLIVALIAYVERSTLKTYARNLPYVSLGDNIKNRTTMAHLWFEEYMAGDNSIDPEQEVLVRLTSSRDILKGAYDGKTTELGDFPETDDEETRALLKEGMIEVDELIAAARERLKTRQASTPEVSAPVIDSMGTVMESAAPTQTGHAGGELDQQFDGAYNRFQATMDRLVDHVNRNVQSDTGYVNTLSWISIGLLVIAVVALCMLLYRLQFKAETVADENTTRIAQQEHSTAALSTFIESISAGNYSVDLTLEGDQGLSQSLLAMRNKLRENADSDRKRNWATSGLAQIGEILRNSNATTEQLYDNIIKFVVKYTRSNQGGLFILNEDNETDKYLDLVACYAFERKKYMSRQVSLGDGLVGQCFLEGERIYLTEVPQEYVSITSGLGGATPNAVLLVPLRVNDANFGVLELATFTRYEDFEIELVEKLAESIASTISTVRVNESTRILLERTQQQAEEMRAQEEEMRQNMEELEATQEEMRRKEKHIQAMLESEKERNEMNHKNRQVVLELTKDRDVQAGNWNSALEKITRSITRQLHVSRASVWTYDETTETLQDEKLHQGSTDAFESGTVLSATDFPAYFRAVKAGELIMASDARTHGVTREFASGYLEANRIHSMVCVPFYHDSKIAGIICVEQQNESKEWNDDHVEFLKSCADLVTVTFSTMKINEMMYRLYDAQSAMQTIIDNLPRAIFWKDKDLKFQGCNMNFALAAGKRSPQEIIGHTDFDMPWKEHAEAYRADDLAVMRSKAPRLDQEERNVNPSGGVSWVLTSKVPILDSHGEASAVLGMFEDITARKRQDAEISARLQELEQYKKGTA